MELFKRILALVLCIVMCFAVVACESSDNDDESSEEDESSKIEEVEGDPDCEHEWSDHEIIGEKPCTEESTEIRTCTICSRVEIVRTIAATGHTYDDSGERCEVCGKRARTSCNHESGEWVTIAEATCDDDGFENFICEECKFIVSTNYLYSLGHDYIYEGYKDPTCTEVGHYGYETCSRCDYSTYDEIPALGHYFIAGDCDRCDTVDETFTIIPGTSADKSELVIAGITESVIEAGTAVITTHNGNIASTSQKDDYTYTATVDGVIRVWVSEVYSGVNFGLYAYDSLGNTVASDGWAYNNDGIDVPVTAGNTYTIRVSGNYATSSYILSIGEPKATLDINNFNCIKDKIEFGSQTNNYTFTPTETGNYTFSFSEIVSGNTLRFFVYNHLGETVGSDNYVYNNDYLTVDLTAGETYTVAVSYNYGVCDYILSVGAQKPTLDIKGYDIIKDSIQYNGQLNNYTFVPDADGTYYFAINDLTDNSYVKFYIYNHLGETVTYDSYQYNGEGLSATLTAGETYTISVSQYSGLSPYTMSVYYPKAPVELTNNSGYVDKLDYSNQCNVYTFTVTDSGNYSIAIVGMSDENAYVEVYIKDSNGETVQYDTYIKNRELLGCSLEADATYNIEVYQGYLYPEYTVAVQTAPAE